MEVKEFDGDIDSRKVKTIMKLTDRVKQWFAKPKNKDTPTPHFEERNGVLSVHQDSADNTRYRVMLNPSFIGSIALPSGQNFLSSENGIAVLPMTIDNNTYVINNSISGAYLYLPFSGATVLVAKGVWGDWFPKQFFNSKITFYTGATSYQSPKNQKP